MPTYDYKCDGCGHGFEEWQSFKDEPLKTCPECKTDQLRRLFGGGAAIIFKGSGFYETDYRKQSYKEAAKKDQEAAKATDGKSDPVKPDTKAEPAAAKPADTALAAAPTAADAKS